MRAQSIYSYFASKHEIYDAMFLAGTRRSSTGWSAVTDDDLAADPVAAARRSIHAVRRVLHERSGPIPAAVPAHHPRLRPVGGELVRRGAGIRAVRERLAAVGVRDQPTLDLWTAVMTGITDQQISNDPGGDRWTQLVDRAVDMLLATPDAPPTTKPESEPS